MVHIPVAGLPVARRAPVRIDVVDGLALDDAEVGTAQIDGWPGVVDDDIGLFAEWDALSQPAVRVGRELAPDVDQTSDQIVHGRLLSLYAIS